MLHHQFIWKLRVFLEIGQFYPENVKEKKQQIFVPPAPSDKYHPWRIYQPSIHQATFILEIL